MTARRIVNNKILNIDNDFRAQGTHAFEVRDYSMPLCKSKFRPFPAISFTDGESWDILVSFII